jgi:hypothetical protein
MGMIPWATRCYSLANLLPSSSSGAIDKSTVSDSLIPSFMNVYQANQAEKPSSPVCATFEVISITSRKQYHILDLSLTHNSLVNGQNIAG